VTPDLKRWLKNMEWIIAVVVLLVGGSILFEVINDLRAKRVARAYCEENEIEIIELKAYKNAYGVYFRCHGKREYARYSYYGKGKLIWAKDSPLEIIGKANKTR